LDGHKAKRHERRFRQMKRQGDWRTTVGVAAAGGALLALGVTGLPGVASAASTKHAPAGAVITYAEAAGGSPNYIFPVTPVSNGSLYNIDQFMNFMWPLIYLPYPYQPTMDYQHSMAYPPVWNKTDTEVTVTLKHYMWSDGVPVTARDVVFYINLAEALGTSWNGYSGPSAFPYNLKSYKAISPTTVQFVLKAPINPTYFVDNGIDYIYPIPQHAWDKTCASCPVGNYDMTPAGAKKVLAFLSKQASDTSTYTTNPLWKVVDGPWQLKSFGGASSPTIFVPNPHFSGTKPTVSEFEEVPFTSDSAEFTALRAGTLDYGYVPPQDFPAIPALHAEGYNTSAIHDWGFDMMVPNLKNPAMGAVLSQTYIRQVLAHLVDQQTIISHFMYGLGSPGYGPVPIYPKGNPFVSPAELSDPYPYSVKTAEDMLRAHGWQVNPGKVDVCMKGGPGGCGAGVATGTKLSLDLLYSSGLTTLQEEVDLFQSDAALAGIQVNPRAESFNTVITVVSPCVKKGTPQCNWQLGEWGGLGLSTYPSGEGVFNTDGAFNVGSFSDPLLDKYIAESTTANNLGPFKAYEDLTIKDEPWIFVPDPDHIAATKAGLTGYGLTSEFAGFRSYIEPNFWFFK
jgi:peptide/nickel transport system substrate-binding protein